MSERSDIEQVWGEIVGDAFTPSQPVPPPPEFAGAIDEEMQSRPSARLPLHVVPLSGPDSDALPIEVAERPSASRASNGATRSPAQRRSATRRPQSEADALAAPQVQVADPVVAVDVRPRRRKLPPTMRTAAVRVEDDLDVALFEVAQTGPYAVVPAEEIVELDVTDLDVEGHPALAEADGRAVIEVDLDDVVDHDDAVVAGEIDIKDPSAALRAPDPIARSAAIANAMRGATVRVPLVPERKVKTAVPSAVPSTALGKPSTVRVVAVSPVEPVRARTPVPTTAAVPAQPIVAPTPAPVAAVPPPSDPSLERAPSSSVSLRRIALGEHVVAPKRRIPWMWVAGAAAVALGAIAIAAAVDDDAAPEAAAASAQRVVASTAEPEPPSRAPTPVEAPAPTQPEVVDTPSSAPAATPEDEASEPVANDPAPTADRQPAVDDAKHAAGLAYVAAVERYEQDRSNEALEAMVSAACAMDDGPRARSAFRKLRGGDQRSRVMVACRERGIDLWARVDGPTAGELLVVAQRQLDEGDYEHALQTARESNHVARNYGALMVMGIAQCKLGRPAEAEALERHLPPRMRRDLQIACAKS